MDFTFQIPAGQPSQDSLQKEQGIDCRSKAFGGEAGNPVRWNQLMVEAVVMDS